MFYINDFQALNLVVILFGEKTKMKLLKAKVLADRGHVKKKKSLLFLMQIRKPSIAIMFVLLGGQMLL